MCRIYKDGRFFESLENLIRFGIQTFADDGHGHVAYRGHADEDWQLVPRLFRTQSQIPRVEKQAFVNRRMITWQFLSDLLETGILPSRQDLTYLQLLAIAQHYPEYPNACGTELLDCSWSLRVAASFAFRAASTGQVGAIYIMYPLEVKDLLLGVVDAVELPEFFLRPTRQKAVFLRQFSPEVNERGLFDKYYFRQTGIWPPSLGPEFTQDYLLGDTADPVLRFSRHWTPYVAPKIGELDIRWLLETEYHLLGLCTRPKNETWVWTDTILEAIFHLFRGRARESDALLSTLRLDRIEEALLDKALSHAVWVVIGLIRSMSLSMLGNWVDGVEQIQRLLSITAASNTKGVLYNQLGNLYVKAAKLQEALAAYEYADRLESGELVSTFNIATTLRSMGRYRESLKKLNTIVFEIDGEDSLAWSERANVLNNLREFRLALDSAERALELDGDLAFAWGHKGVALMGLAEFREAQESFRVMLRLRPVSDWALFNLCAALHYDGKKNDALRAFGRLKSLNPNYPRLCVLERLISASVEGGQ